MTPKIRLGLTALGTIRQYYRSLKKPQILDFLRIWGFSDPLEIRTPDTLLKRRVHRIRKSIENTGFFEHLTLENPALIPHRGTQIIQNYNK